MNNRNYLGKKPVFVVEDIAANNVLMKWLEDS